MLELTVAAVILIITCIVAAIWLHSQNSETTLVRSSTIPGLKPSDKKSGNFSELNKEGSFHSFLKKLHDNFGPIASFWFGQEYVVSIASPELFKEHLKFYNRPAIIFGAQEPLIGVHSIQYSNGDEWKNKRKIYDKYFSHEMLTSYLSTFTEIAEHWVEKQKKLSEANSVALHESMMALALQSILATAFGFTCEDENKIYQFNHLYDLIWLGTESRQFGDAIEKGSAEEVRLLGNIKNFRTFVSEIIANRKKSQDVDTYIFLDNLLDNSMTEDMLMSEVITYIIGGYHTTGNLLTWTFYYLAIHPEIQEKVYKEMIEVLGETTPITPEKINQLTYTNQVIKESNRCSVLAPYAARFADNDVEVGGYVIPAKTPVLHALGVVLQDPNIWPEPEKFDPDRFSVKNSQERSSLAFCVFGFAGQRICPGQKFSTYEMLCFMSVICRTFHLKLATDQKVNRAHGLVTKPDREIPMIFSLRK